MKNYVKLSEIKKLKTSELRKVKGGAGEPPIIIKPGHGEIIIPLYGVKI